MSVNNNGLAKVPNHQPRDLSQRLLELFIGLLPFAFLALIVLLSRYDFELAAIILIVYSLIWLIRLIGYSYRLAASFYYLRLSKMIDWQAKLEDVMGQEVLVKVGSYWQTRAEKWYRRVLDNGVSLESRLDPKTLYQAIIVAVYRESAEIIEQTVKGVIASTYDPDKIIILLAYEERGGANTEVAVNKLVRKYDGQLNSIIAIKHPDNLQGEAKAKAGNITYAAKYLSAYCRDNKIAAEEVLVTTLDADSWPHPQYLSALAWTYCLAAKRQKRSYQPMPLFTNNIWDAPALVRVVAADSSFWFMIWAMKSERLRLFSAYAQSLQTLENVNYWNVESVVEDGHQYWRSYFTYSGDHQALPIWLPIYQDAVLSETYFKTLIDQFRQLLRWSWGTADTPWLIRQSLNDRSISWSNKLTKIYHQVDDYIAWSTAPIILSIGGWLPLLLSPNYQHSILVHRLPYLISGIQIVALIGFIVPFAASLLNLPPRPAHYTRYKNIFMVLQWVLEPIALIFYIALSSLDAHARLVINKPLEVFHATNKTRRSKPVA